MGSAETQLIMSHQEFGSRWMSIERKSIWTVHVILMNATYIVFP